MRLNPSSGGQGSDNRPSKFRKYKPPYLPMVTQNNALRLSSTRPSIPSPAQSRAGRTTHRYTQAYTSPQPSSRFDLHRNLLHTKHQPPERLISPERESSKNTDQPQSAPRVLKCHYVDAREYWCYCYLADSMAEEIQSHLRFATTSS